MRDRREGESHEMRLKSFAAGLMAATAIAVSAGLADAAPVKLTISSWAPPGHGMNAQMWPQLIKMIEEATNGRVTAQIKYKLASPPAQFDLIQDGAADITWIFHGYTPGRFTVTKLIELPGYEGGAEAASVAYWRAYEKYLKKANEHRGVMVIGLMTHGPGQLHTVKGKKVTQLSQIKGLKLRLGGGVSGDVGAALGATGIRVPAPKVYETLSSHAADGVMFPMESRKGFKLDEVAPNVYMMPGGFYRGSFAIIMNPDRFRSLSPEDQKALREKVFGEPLSRMAGRVWETNDAKAIKAAKENPAVSVTVASEEDQKAYAKIAEKIRDKVLKEVAAKGIDGKAVMAYIREQMKAYK